MKMIPIPASKARQNFFPIIDDVFLNENLYEIRKNNIPVAWIIKPQRKEDTDLMKFAGAWGDWKDMKSEAKKMIVSVYKGRKDEGKEKKNIPHF